MENDVNQKRALYTTMAAITYLCQSAFDGLKEYEWYTLPIFSLFLYLLTKTFIETENFKFGNIKEYKFDEKLKEFIKNKWLKRIVFPLELIFGGLKMASIVIFSSLLSVFSVLFICISFLAATNEPINAPPDDILLYISKIVGVMLILFSYRFFAETIMVVIMERKPKNNNSFHKFLKYCYSTTKNRDRFSDIILVIIILIIIRLQIIWDYYEVSQFFM